MHETGWYGRSTHRVRGQARAAGRTARTVRHAFRTAPTRPDRLRPGVDRPEISVRARSRTAGGTDARELGVIPAMNRGRQRFATAMTPAALGPVFYTEQNLYSVRYTSVRVSFRDPPPGP